MPRYEVVIPEIHYSYRYVEANNKEDAIDKAQYFGEGVEEYLEYSHSKEPISVTEIEEPVNPFDQKNN